MIIKYSIIVFITQLVFIGFRTVNVKAISDRNMTGAMVSGGVVHIAWLISIAIGAVSMNEIITNFQWQYLPIVICSLTGGLLGTYIALRDKLESKSIDRVPVASKTINPKILILGHARHGKDTVAEILRDNYGISFKSSSMAALDVFIYEKLRDKYNYKSKEECFADRVNHRKEWHDLICDYNKDDKSRLCKEILKVSDCYVGMRSQEEYEASKHLFDHVIWVDASGRIDLESEDSMNIRLDQSMHYLSNRHSLRKLEGRIKSFAKDIELV